MQTLIIELDSSNKAKELSSLLSSLDFVKKVSSISKPKALIAALQEHENLKTSIVKRKNKAIARYL
jgi:APAF-1 helical domain